MHKAVVLAGLLLILLPTMAEAQGTWTAASCNQSDVNAVINGPTHVAINADTINIPGGSCTWTSQLLIPGNIGISLLGAGQSSTTITDNVPNGTYMIFASPTQGSATLRISSMTLTPQASTTPSAPIAITGTCNATSCPNIRIDHITFPTAWGSASLSDGTVTRVSNVFGVMDHNTVAMDGAGSGILLANVNHGSWGGVGLYGDNSWASADTFGTAQALYIEDNQFQVATAEDTDGADAFENVGGGRVVVRHNTYTSLGSSASYFHGTDTSGRPRGGRQIEFYSNNITCTVDCVGVLATLRSGTGIFYSNSVSVNASGAAANGLISLLIERRGRYSTPWGYCDGTGSFDQNDGAVYASGSVTTGGTSSFSDSSKNWSMNQWAGSAVTNGTPYSVHDTTFHSPDPGILFGSEIQSNTATQYSIYTVIGQNGGNDSITWNFGDGYNIQRATLCVDQPGRGAGVLLSGGTPSPTGWVNETLDPVYEWADTVNVIQGAYYNPGITSTVNGTSALIANRDWYAETQNQAAQTSPTSPFDGASGTGHGTLANRPTTCTPYVGYWSTDQNTLYKCTAPNTWATFYQPYTYPHPLTGSQTSSAPSFVQGAGNNGYNASSLSATFTNNVASGDWLGADVLVGTQTVTLNSITATCISGGFNLVNNPTNFSNVSFAAMGYATVSSSGPCTVTATLSGASVGNFAIIVHEIRGVGGFEGSAMQTQTAPGTSANAIMSPALTTAHNNDYIFGVTNNGANNGTWCTASCTAGTSPPAYVFRTNDSSGINLAQSEDASQASAGSVWATFTDPTDGGYAGYITGIMAFHP